MNVLLVDDEQELVSALAERLGLRGIDATWTTSGQEAIALLEKQTFDIAVLDVKMPNMGGLELKRRLEELQPGLRFIFVTGHGSEEDFRTGSSEAASYLVKPVSIDALIVTMESALAQPLQTGAR